MGSRRMLRGLLGASLVVGCAAGQLDAPVDEAEVGPALDAATEQPDATQPADAAPPEDAAPYDAWVLNDYALPDAYVPDVGPPDQGPPPVLRHVVIVGPEESVGQGGSRPSIAVDARQQPHIAVNDGGNTRIFLHHRLAGAWQGGQVAAARDFSDRGQLLESPRLEIGPQGRGWLSGHLFRSDVVEACGHAVLRIDAMPTAPAVVWARRHYRHWGHGMLSTDPARPDEAIVVTFNGQWVRVGANGEAAGTGELYPGTTGEKVDFKIAPDLPGEGVWHIMHSGYSRSSSSYQNSRRAARGEPIAVWAEHSCYPEQGLDTRRPSVGIDGADPEMAYFAVGYDPGVVINIWNGARMLFDPCSLPVIEPEDRDQGNGTYRFAPQWAPAFGGGAFLCWTHSSKEVRLRYVGPNGGLGEVVVIGPGQQCAPATDTAGQLHLAYIRDGALRYRALTVE
jgi:hypothetical protein